MLVGHSESGLFPELAALAGPSGVRAIISLEPGGGLTATPEQLAVLTKIPVLFVYGDHLDTPGTLNWVAAFQSAQTFVNQLRAAGGDATIIQLPQLGIHGNSHMMFQDRNNLQVADVLMSWIRQHVK